MTLSSEPLLTDETTRDAFIPRAGAAYMYGSESEDRAIFGRDWQSTALKDHVSFVSVSVQYDDELIVSAHGLNVVDEALSARDSGAIRELLQRLPSPLYLDITGLSYSAWAPIVRTAILENLDLRVVYVQPKEYRKSPDPAQGLIFDLSERISGIAPLPGFARLRRPRGFDDGLFVPFLGFEGARLGYLLEETEPLPAMTVPVIGVPGFRPDYTFFSYSGNRVPLEAMYRASQVRLAKANCPFDAFHTLVEIAQDYPGVYMRIAPLGTKPHGLGAVLFALSRPESVEIIYDHPVRRPEGTSGESVLCVYDVGAFSQSDLFLRNGAHASAH